MQIPTEIIKTGFSLSDRFFDLPGLAVYSGMSVSTLRYHIRQNKLPAYSIRGSNDRPGKLLVKLSEFDQWMKHHRWQPDIHDITGDSKINELLGRLQKG